MKSLSKTLDKIFSIRRNANTHNSARRRLAKGLRVEQLEDRRLLAVLFADSFEQGEWNGKWVEDGQNDWARTTQQAFDGAYAAEVDGLATNATLSMAIPLDLATYTSAEVSFSWYIESSWDTGEYIALDFFDGISWTEVASLNGNVDQEDVWHSETITIDGAHLVDGFNLRFRSSVSSNQEDGFVDNVRITGTPVAPIQVFLMVGQSNMAGSPNVTDLTAPHNAPQSDVWIWQDNLAQQVGWTPLRGGFGAFSSNHSAGGDGSKFGPEVAFGRELADSLPDTHFAVIKYSQAGTAATMKNGWSPDRGGGDGPGQIWTDFIAMSQDALTTLGNDGISYEIAGLIVAQGERDMLSETGDEAANYEQNFTQFIGAVRQEFGKSDLPVVFARSGDSLEATEWHDGSLFVRSAQEAVAAADPLATMIQADDLSTLDNTHFDAEGQLTFGGRLANAFLGKPFEGSAKAGTDGFETGDFSGGYEQWSVGAWTVAGDASVTATSDPRWGAYNAQLQGSSADLIRSADVTGLTNVKLRFVSRLNSFETSDTAQVKVSGDGVNWTTLKVFVDGQDDNLYRAHEVAVPDLGDTIYVRFDAEMDSLDDYWYVDAVKLVGTTPAGPIGNQPPAASAGLDQLIGDGDANGSETVTLVGSASDSDGTVVGYEWTEGGTIIGSTKNISPTLAIGVHTLTLTVTDNEGATGSDSVVITVVANQGPSADAGQDLSVVDSDNSGSEQVTVNGSGLDVDGSIVSYQWSDGTNVLGTSATLITTLTLGTHTLTLTVTDNGGATASDTVDVTVTQMLSTKFYVVNDASTNRTYEYDALGGAIENYAINSGNSAPRGAASTAAGTTVWVADKNRKVFMYDTAGGLQGSWTAGTLNSKSQVEGLATNGSDVWIVDNRTDTVYRYTGAAGRTSGSQNAASSFSLNSSNTNPKGIVTDGTYLWVVNDSSIDKVFKYSLSGSLLGSWNIDSANQLPTGLTIDPANGSQSIWIVDSGTDKVYEYANARGTTSGILSATVTFSLASGNSNPQGIADPPAPGSRPDVARLPAVQSVSAMAPPLDSNRPNPVADARRNDEQPKALNRSDVHDQLLDRFTAAGFGTDRNPMPPANESPELSEVPAVDDADDVFSLNEPFDAVDETLLGLLAHQRSLS